MVVQELPPQQSDGEVETSMCCLGANGDPSLLLACPEEIQLDKAYSYNPDNEECKLVQTETIFIDYDVDGMYNPEVDEI